MPLTLPPSAQLWLRLLLLLATSVWFGGYVAVAVMALSSRKALEPAARVTFFRQFGRDYLPIGGSALVLALLCGALLLAQRQADWLTWLALWAGLLLAALLAVAVAQARRLTRLKQSAQRYPADATLTVAIKRTGRAAACLRALLGLLSLALMFLGSLMVA